MRFCGWVPKKLGKNSKTKKTYWYGVTDSKIYIVSNMKSNLGKKKIRVKQFPRISAVISNSSENALWNLGIVPMNFAKYIN